MASPRLRAASMAIWRFSLSRCWPVKSTSLFGRSDGFQLTLIFAPRRGNKAIGHKLRRRHRTSSSAFGTAAQSHRGRRVRGLFRRPPPPCGRAASQIQQAPKESTSSSSRESVGCAATSSPGRGQQFVAQLEHQSLRRLLAHAQNAHQFVQLIPAYRREQDRRLPFLSEYLDHQARTDPAYADQFFEQVASRRGSEEPIQRMMSSRTCV